MFPIHCNNCSKKRGDCPKLQFELTRCHHIICGNCLPKATDCKECPVCKRPLHSIGIAHNMPENVVHYFKDPARFLTMYKNISKFQNEQRAYYYWHFQKRQHLFNEKKQKLNGYIKMETQLRQQIDVEKKRIAELQNYIAYHDRRDEAMLKNTSYSSNDISSTVRRLSRPRTPSLSTTVTTLTDNGDNVGLSDNEHQKEYQQRKSRPLNNWKIKTDGKDKDTIDFDY